MKKQARFFTHPFRKTRRPRKYPRRDYVQAKRKRARKAKVRASHKQLARPTETLVRRPEIREVAEPQRDGQWDREAVEA